MIELEFPLRIVSEKNVREHWAKKARRVRTQKMITLIALGNAFGEFPRGRKCIVTLTRIAPRPLDDDNLPRALSAVRDCVAAYLMDSGKPAGMDDGDPRLTWHYAQERGAPKYYAVRIEIEEAGDG